MSSAIEIRAPSEETEGTRSQILRWLKRPGESVRENEPLIEIETDKVTVEVASPASGVLREILKNEQDEITPGELLGRLEAQQSTGTAASGTAASATPARSAPPPGKEPGAATASGATRAAATGQLSPAVRRLLAEHALDAATVEGSGPAG